MRNQRSFSFRIQAPGSGGTAQWRKQAQICRWYNIYSSVLYHWKKQYTQGKLDNEPTEEGVLRDRIEKTGTPSGQANFRKRVLKKGLAEQHQPVRQKRGNPHAVETSSSAVSGGGVGL